MSPSKQSFHSRNLIRLSRPYMNESGPGDYNLPSTIGKKSSVIGGSSPSYSIPQKTKGTYFTIDHQKVREVFFMGSSLILPLMQWAANFINMKLMLLNPQARKFLLEMNVVSNNSDSLLKHKILPGTFRRLNNCY